MKRSAQVGLVMMGALGVTGAGGYYLAKRDTACPPAPQTGVAGAPQPGAAVKEDECRRWGATSSSSGTSSRYYRTWWPDWWGSRTTSTSTSAAATARPGTSTATQPAGAVRGGFGSTGHGIASGS